MTVSDRDKKILIVIVPFAVVLAYWFLLLAPKREAATTASATLETLQTELAQAQASAATAQTAKQNFVRDYASVVALGKAIPTSVDMPSLLVQLEQAAHGSRIELAGVTAGERTTATMPAAGARAPGTAPSGQPPASAPGAAAASAQDTADTANAASGAGTAPGAAGAAPATAGALESVALEFAFKGSFFGLANFFHRLKRFVQVDGEKVRVRGRLMTIDSVQYTADPDAFPALTATVAATVFLSPKAEGVTAGATPAGPAPAAAAPVSSAGNGAAPTPTAAATP